ncbi:fibrous sheath CABYR-binding protein-like [Ictalurus furcatus]|uniref:fibrous sheath CABYR-binding protein-like n=1 Tax=Ictalurus furcatus TaxID=66913 RepID=UPI002350DFC3|nr:fibrous sheath CABYR-binding protein-like [Ictalurus furcatus]
MRKQQVAMSAAEEARIWALYRSSLEMSKQLEEEIAQCKAELRAASSLAPFTPSPPPRSDAVQRSQHSDLSIWGFPMQGRYTMLCSPEVKAGPEIFFGGATRTAELQPEAYGEVSAVELLPEVNMATSERQLKVAEEAVPLPCPAEEAVLLSSPAEEVVMLPCTAEEAVLLSSPAEEVVTLSCTAEEAVLLLCLAQPASPAGDAAQLASPAGDAAQPASPAGDAAQPASPAGGRCPVFQSCWGAVPCVPELPGGVAPPLRCPTEAASLSVAARDSSHRGPGPLLEGGSWCSGRSTLWTGVLSCHGQRRALARLRMSHVTLFLFARFLIEHFVLSDFNLPQVSML